MVEEWDPAVVLADYKSRMEAELHSKETAVEVSCLASTSTQNKYNIFDVHCEVQCRVRCVLRGNGVCDVVGLMWRLRKWNSSCNFL